MSTNQLKLWNDTQPTLLINNGKLLKKTSIRKKESENILIDKTAEVLRLAELRRTLGQVLKEALIRLVEALKYFLHGLAVKQTTGYASDEKGFHP